MKAAGVSVNCDRRESSAALRRPARDTSAPTRATLKMDLTNTYFPRENCWRKQSPLSKVGTVLFSFGALKC